MGFAVSDDKANPPQLRRSVGGVKLATVDIDSIVAQRECFEGICGGRDCDS
jgi:hypothetical protein